MLKAVNKICHVYKNYFIMFTIVDTFISLGPFVWVADVSICFADE